MVLFTHGSNCEFYWWLSGDSQHGVGVGARVLNCLHVLICVLRMGDKSVELPSPSFPLLYVRATSVQTGRCYCLRELGSITSRPSLLSSGGNLSQGHTERPTTTPTDNLDFQIRPTCHMFFGLWEEAGYNPCCHRDNMQTPRRQALGTCHFLAAR